MFGSLLVFTSVFLAICASAKAVNVNSTLLSRHHQSTMEYETVSKLNLDAYAGKWFQVYDNKLAEIYVPKGARCTTADYGAIEGADNSVSVHNFCLYPDNQGMYATSTIDGVATASNPDEEGQLVLKLDGVPFPGEYWVFELGPINADGLYDYSIVSGSKAPNNAMYILARDVNTFKTTYESDVLANVADMGFTGILSKPIETYHGADCDYE